MPEGKECVVAAALRRRSKRARKGLRVARRRTGKRVGRRAEQLDDGARMEPEEVAISYVPPVLVL